MARLPMRSITMGKTSGKLHVDEPFVAKAMDRQPFTKAGDAWARGLSEETMRKYASREGMADVTQRVFNKGVLKDKDGNTVEPMAMQDGVPYVIQTQSGKNIGWMMRKGAAGVGRIYQKDTDSFRSMRNDPDRPSELKDISFDFDEDEPELPERPADRNAAVPNAMPATEVQAEF